MLLRLVIFLLIIGLSEYYSYIVVRSALRTLPPGGRKFFLILYVLLSVATWVGMLLFRQINWAGIPHMVRNIYVAFTIGFLLGKVVILLIMLGDEVRRFVVWIAHKLQPAATVTPGNGISRSVFLSRLALILGGSILGTFLYGITNRYRYRVHRLQLKLADLPEAFRGMRIVQLSDIHSGSFDNRKAVEHGVEMVMDERPDLILFTGDLVNNKADEIQPYINIFSKLKAPLGIYSTLGNHDYGDYVPWPSIEDKAKNLQWLKDSHAKMGWRLLMNEHVVLERNGDKIALLGIENWGAKAGFPKYGNMNKAYEGLEEKQVPFKILLSHDPSHWDAQVRPEYPNVQLTFSGHTHGMQMGIEIPGFKWSPSQYVYKEWAGLYREGKQYLYVNRGFGFLGYPGRLGILPEITVIDLV